MALKPTIGGQQIAKPRRMTEGDDLRNVTVRSIEENLARKQINKVPQILAEPVPIPVDTPGFIRTWFSKGVSIIQDGVIQPGIDVATLPDSIYNALKSKLTIKGHIQKAAKKEFIESGQLPAAAQKAPKFQVVKVPHQPLPKKGAVQTVYYARPAWMMNTSLDEVNITALKSKYPGAKILMARKGEHKNDRMGDSFNIKAKKNMDVFFNRVLKADIVVGVESERSSLSSGVHAELRKAQKAGIQTRVLRGNSLKPIRDMQVIPQPEKRRQGTTWSKIRLLN